MWTIDLIGRFFVTFALLSQAVYVDIATVCKDLEISNPVTPMSVFEQRQNATWEI